MTEQEDAYCTFSDEGFERRYSSEDALGGAPSSPEPPCPTIPTGQAQIGRSRNRFMRTLLRRRLAASGRP